MCTKKKNLLSLVVALYKHLHSAPRDPVACVHRDDGDNEFMNVMANGLTAEVLTVGAEFC